VIRLGEQVVVLERVEPTGQVDDYGNDVTRPVWVELHWCNITPAYSTEPTNRNSPSIVGMNLLAPPGNANKIRAADRILYPWTIVRPADGDPFYEGRSWDVVGEVGEWPEAVEVQLGRKV